MRQRHATRWKGKLMRVLHSIVSSVPTLQLLICLLKEGSWVRCCVDDSNPIEFPGTDLDFNERRRRLVRTLTTETTNLARRNLPRTATVDETREMDADRSS